jgi:hypothetical protein
MTTQLVATAAGNWHFDPEDPAATAGQIQPLLLGRALDEITGAPPDAPVRASAAATDLLARAAGGGRVGLVGRPLALYAPGFVAGAALRMTVAADGFIPLDLEGTLGPQPGYPDAFFPIDLGDLAFHRLPTSISGRTVSHARVARAGASVQISGVWATQADVLNNPNTPAPPNVVAIAPGLYADRPLGSGVSALAITLAPAAEAKSLLRAAPAASTEVRLSDQLVLNPGDLIAIEPFDLTRTEVIAVSSIVDPGAGLDQPATVRLAHPLRRDHAQAVMVIRAIAGAPGAANALGRAGRAGDVSLFPTTLTGLDASMRALEIVGGPAPPEYHGLTGVASSYPAAAVYTALSDLDGYVRLPPIHRLAQVEIRVDHPAEPTPLVRPLSIDWGRDEIVVDLVFP